MMTITVTWPTAVWPAMLLQGLTFRRTGNLPKNRSPRHRLTSVGLCMLALSFWILVLLGFNSALAPALFSRPFASKSLNSGLRADTINMLAPDRRWTREACVRHWASGIDQLAFGRLANKRVFLGMNLKNNELECDHFLGEILLLAEFLGPLRIHISIYESGSNDATPEKLQAFERELNALQIPNTIITNGLTRRPGQTRIDFLVNARNMALNPLLKQVWEGPHGNFENGTYAAGNGCCDPLTSVEVYATSDQIYGLRLSFGGVTKGRMGSPIGERHVLDLQRGEYVTSVEGAGEGHLVKLKMITNRGEVLLAGDPSAEGWQSTGNRLDDISGFYSEDAIHALSFAWADMAPDPSRRFDRVLLLNDGYLCAEDILMLLMHDATMATAIDTIGIPEGEHTRSFMVYDTWVGRDIDGQEQERNFPISNIQTVRQWFVDAKPIPVSCACHGAVNIDSDVFYTKRITFRNRGWEGECAASEYSFFCKDIWNAYRERTKIVMDPRVVVGIDVAAWEHVTLARAKKLPPYFKEDPFDTGIQPSAWKPPPVIDRRLVENTLSHLPFPYPVPKHMMCVPIHHDSVREAALIGKYEEAIEGLPAYPRGPWKRNESCHVGSNAYLSRYTEPGSSLFYYNSAGATKISPKRLIVGGSERLVSPNFQFMFLMQRNGQCIVYRLKNPFQPVWRWPWCDRPGIAYVEFQSDGNLVAYDTSTQAVIASSTTAGERRAKHLALLDDGRLVLTSLTGDVVWEADQTFLAESASWFTKRSGYQIFIPITLTGIDAEFEGATAVGELCQALSGRVFFSLVFLGEGEMPAIEAALHGILLEYMCSFTSSGVASSPDQARELHVATYNEWSTGRAHSCAKAFPVHESGTCLRDFIGDFTSKMHGERSAEPCTAADARGATFLDPSAVCCDAPTY